MLVVALTSVACSVASPAATPIVIYVTPSPGQATAQPQVSSLPTPTSTPAPTSTQAPAPTATAQSTSAAEQGETVMRTSESFGYVTAQLITVVTNTGTTWIEISQYDSNWTIYDKTGGVISTGGYVEAIGPRFLGPGEMGYVVASDFNGDYRQSDFDHGDIDVYFNEANPTPSDLSTENTRVRKDSSEDVEVTGEIRNSGTSRVDSVTVLAVFLDASGQPLGFADGLFDNVEPGGTRAFQITSGLVEISLADIAQTVIYAVDDSF
jgi:hypothetical protein